MTTTKHDLAGRSIIVTGAAQGIGLAVTELIVSSGGKVTAVDLNGQGLDGLADRLGRDKVAVLAADVSDPQTAQRAVDLAVSTFGPVDGLVNNAGVVRASMIEKMSVESWRTVIDVHLSGSFYFLQAVGRHVLARNGDAARPGCSIVNVSSDAGRKGTIGQINYGAAKAGLFGLTMCAAREWAKLDLRVNTVAFGVVETPMTEAIRGEKFRDKYLSQIPLGRWAGPLEGAHPICFLLSEAASYITGQHLSVNGGYTIGL